MKIEEKSLEAFHKRWPKKLFQDDNTYQLACMVWLSCYESAKAVLDAAGVKYGD